MITPLIHDFGYEAIMQDFIPIVNEKVTTIIDGKQVLSVVKDTFIYPFIKYNHIAQVFYAFVILVYKGRFWSFWQRE